MRLVEGGEDAVAYFPGGVGVGAGAEGGDDAEGVGAGDQGVGAFGEGFVVVVFAVADLGVGVSMVRCMGYGEGADGRVSPSVSE